MNLFLLISVFFVQGCQNYGSAWIAVTLQRSW